LLPEAAVGVTVCPLPVRDHAHHDKLIPRYLRWEILTTKLAIGLAGAFLGAVCLGQVGHFLAGANELPATPSVLTLGEETTMHN
jgi:hypothetical protein